MIEPITLSGVTNTSGDVTVISGRTTVGYLEAIRLEATGLTDGADVTCSVGGTDVLGLTDGDVSSFYYPRSAANATADGTALSGEYAPIIVEGAPKVVVASGGNAKSFSATFYIRK